MKSFKQLFYLLSFFTVCLTACSKQSFDSTLEGTWIQVGATGNGPADTLVFSSKNGLHFFSTNLMGWGGKNVIETPCIYKNGELSFLDYEDPAYGYTKAESFRWIKTGKEFEVFLYEFVLTMSDNKMVRYIKR